MKRSLAAVLLAAASLLSLGVVSATAADTYTVVTPQNFDAVFPIKDVRPDSSYQFRFGPPQPPLGLGSLQLSTVTSSGKQQHLEVDQQGTLLSAVDAMGYSTYREQGTAQQDTALNMAIYTNPGGPPCPNDPMAVVTPGCNTFTTLVYEPVYNIVPAGPVLDRAWQTWDAYRGGSAIWWSSRNIPGVCASSCYVLWSAIVAANPNAAIIGYGLNQGTYNPGLTVDNDALKIGTGGDTATYDFEPSAEQCKNGGYATADPPYKNQGQCIAAVNRGPKR